MNNKDLNAFNALAEKRSPCEHYTKTLFNLSSYANACVRSKKEQNNRQCINKMH